MSTSAPTLDSLAAQIQDLQQQLADLTGNQADTLTPSYLTYNNGEVGADFTGTISAKGILIPAYIGSTEPAFPNEVEWVDEGGAAVAFIAGQQDPSASVNYLRIASIGDPASGISTVTIGSQDNAGNTPALLVTNTVPGDSTYVSAVAGDYVMVIINDAGESSFMQQAQAWGQIYGISNAIPYNSETIIAWDAGNQATGNGMSCSGEYMGVPEAGIYRLEAVATAASANFTNTGFMELFADVNGGLINFSTDTTAVQAGPTNYPSARLSMLLELNAGDSVSVYMYQDITAASNSMTMQGGHMSLVRVAGTANPQ